MRTCPNCRSIYIRDVSHCGLDGTFLTESNDAPLLGHTIDHYKVVRFLGQDAISQVYHATHTYTGQPSVLKVFYGDFASDETIAKHFHSQLPALAKIKHPNIVHLEDFGATEEGVLFMVLESLTGHSLAQTLQERGPFGPLSVAELIRQISAGLGAAHQEGIVHQDLKPANVVLVQSAGKEIAKILNLGLAHLFEPESDEQQRSPRDHSMGTPTYLAPEQLAGTYTDPRSDLYALGVLAYELLTGAPPISGSYDEIVAQHTRAQAPQLSVGSPALEILVLRLLAKSPEMRPGSASKVIELISAALSPARTRAASTAPVRAERLPSALSEPERRSSTGGWSLDLTEPDPVPLSLGLDLSEPAEKASQKATSPKFRLRWTLLTAALVACTAGAIYLWPRAQPNSIPLQTAHPSTAETSAPDAPSKPAALAVARKKQNVRPNKDPSSTGVATQTKPAPQPGLPSGQRKQNKPNAQIPPPENHLLRKNKTLVTRLKNLGLRWKHLAAVERHHAQLWKTWLASTPQPPADKINETYERLLRALRDLRTDRTVLQKRTHRLSLMLRKIPQSDQSPKAIALRFREEELKRQASTYPLSRSKHTLLGDIDTAEEEVENYLTQSPKPDSAQNRQKAAAQEPADALDQAMKRISEKADTSTKTD